MTAKHPLLLLLGLSCVLALGDRGKNPWEESIRPEWHVGDRWVVETLTRPVGSALPGAGQPVVVRWDFHVAAIERLDGRECFRIEVVGQHGPSGWLWIERPSLRVCRMEAAIVVGGQARLLTEDYAPVGGAAAPWLSPLPGLPVDLPAFSLGGAKRLETASYKALPGVAGQKGPADVEFLVPVEQECLAASDPQIKALADDPFAQDAGKGATVGVWLKGPFGQVRQLWKPGMPWPVCAANGSTTSRLVAFNPAGKAEEGER